jgi:hypothetical protein
MKIFKRYLGKGGKPSAEPAEIPWYFRLLLPITVPSGMLYSKFHEFYTVYGASRFWSGVVLAFILTIYIESLRKKAMKKIENVGNSE